MVALLAFPKGVQLPTQLKLVRCFSAKIFPAFVPPKAADQSFPSLAGGSQGTLCLPAVWVKKKDGNILGKGRGGHLGLLLEKCVPAEGLITGAWRPP